MPHLNCQLHSLKQSRLIANYRGEQEEFFQTENKLPLKYSQGRMSEFMIGTGLGETNLMKMFFFLFSTQNPTQDR